MAAHLWYSVGVAFPQPLVLKNLPVIARQRWLVSFSGGSESNEPVSVDWTCCRRTVLRNLELHARNDDDDATKTKLVGVHTDSNLSWHPT